MSPTTPSLRLPPGTRGAAAGPRERAIGEAIAPFGVHFDAIDAAGRPVLGRGVVKR